MPTWALHLPRTSPPLRRKADRDDRCAELPAYGSVGVGDDLLRLRLVLACPGHVEDRPRACGLDRLVEEPDVLVHSFCVLDRQRALFLEHDVVVLTALNRLQRLAGVPVGAKRRASGADQPVLKGLAPRGREPRDQAGEVVAGGEAVADEEHLQRGTASNAGGHVVLRFLAPNGARYALLKQDSADFQRSSAAMGIRLLSGRLEAARQT